MKYHSLWVVMATRNIASHSFFAIRWTKHFPFHSRCIRTHRSASYTLFFCRSCTSNTQLYCMWKFYRSASLFFLVLLFVCLFFILVQIWPSLDIRICARIIIINVDWVLLLSSSNNFFEPPYFQLSFKNELLISIAFAHWQLFQNCLVILKLFSQAESWKFTRKKWMLCIFTQMEKSCVCNKYFECDRVAKWQRVVCYAPRNAFHQRERHRQTNGYFIFFSSCCCCFISLLFLFSFFYFQEMNTHFNIPVLTVWTWSKTVAPINGTNIIFLFTCIVCKTRTTLSVEYV